LEEHFPGMPAAFRNLGLLAYFFGGYGCMEMQPLPFSLAKCTLTATWQFSVLPSVP